MPTARYFPFVAAVEDKLYVAGGNVGVAGSVATLERYDPATDTWTALAPMPSARYKGGVAVLDDKIYVLGGWDFPASTLPTSTVQIYDTLTNTWSFGPSMPTRSGSGPAGVIDGKIYKHSAEQGFSSYPEAFHVLDPVAGTWTPLPSLPAAHEGGAAGIADGKLYVASGTDDPGQHAQVHAYDPITNSWSTLTTGPTPRAGVAGGMLNDQLLIAGGSAGGPPIDVFEAYDIATDDWSTLPPLPLPVSAAGGAVIGDTFYVAGGQVTGGATNALQAFIAAESNQPPTADVGGPYTVAEGSTIQLDASGTTDPDLAFGDMLSYEWDLDYDGVTFDVDTTGVQPVVSFSDDFPARTIAVRVTDSANASSIATSILEVTNVAPTLADFAVTSPINENDVAHLTGTIVDPGTLDAFTLMVDWGDSSGIETINFSGGTTAFDLPHHYLDDNPSGTTQDTYTITATHVDDDQTIEPSFTLASASPLIGPAICKPGYTPPQCTAVPFDTTGNLAFQGNGFAHAAVARDNIFGHEAIHMPEYANDGYYGNGTSWISNSPNSWIKIDLGQTVLIDRMLLGRDRNGGFDDRDPGRFILEIALSDDVYANGNDQNDVAEYNQVFDSATVGFNGIIHGSETLQASFAPVLARYVKLTVQTWEAAIDEIEIFAPTPSGSIPITINNVAPTANADAAATDEDIAVTVDVLANDTDVPGDPLTVSSVNSPTAQGGTVVINADSTLTYTPAANFFGTDTFHYTVSDDEGGNSMGAVSITVDPVNDPPVNSVPGSQGTQTNTPLTFSAADGNPISIADVDALSALIDVTLSVTTGTLTLSGTTGLTVTGNGTASVTITGTISDINAGLNGLTYDPVQGFSGTTNLTISTNDLGHSGEGGPLTDSDLVEITITPSAMVDLVLGVSDAPDPVAVGGTLTYTLTITNNGAFTATGVTLVDELFNGVTFVSAFASQGSGCTHSNGTVRCNLGSLASDASATVTIVVTPSRAGMMINRANVEATQRDSNPANNLALTSTQAEPASPQTVFAAAIDWQYSAAPFAEEPVITSEASISTRESRLWSIYEQLMANDINADGRLDSKQQQGELPLTRETLDDLLFGGSDKLNQFLAGKSLRNLLDELAFARLI